MSNIVVVGAGQSGLGVVEYYIKIGRTVLVTDSSYNINKDVMNRMVALSVPLFLGSHPLHLLDDCTELIISPGVDPSLPFIRLAKEKGISVVGELELAHRILRLRKDGSIILAITGTNGKSTTTDLTTHILKTANISTIACGNIGVPLISVIGNNNNHGFGIRFVLECSSYQLETVETFYADAAVVLNVEPDHLSRHKTMNRYQKIKMRIFERQSKQHLHLINMKYKNHILGNGCKMHFGWKEPDLMGIWCDSSGDLWIKDNNFCKTFLLNRSQLQISGNHNIENVMASSLLALYGGADLLSIRRGLLTYSGLAHRSMLCGNHNGIKYFNDSKATNVHAAANAIESLLGPLIVILGGQDKGVNYNALRQIFFGKVRYLIFYGGAIDCLKRDLGDFPYKAVNNFDDAVNIALSTASYGDTVLLSPACASFDQFDNFEQRGNRFEYLVNRWINK